MDRESWGAKSADDVTESLLNSVLWGGVPCCREKASGANPRRDHQ